MLKQIFRKNVPIEMLFQLLEQICQKNDKYYFIDNNAYKKMLYSQLHETFFHGLSEYYHLSKQFYINRDLTYNSFTTVVRQICKSNNIMFTSQIKYNHSKYNIDYFIYF